MSRYTNAERMALTPIEDVTLNVDAQWALMDNLEVEDRKQNLRRKQDNENARSEDGPFALRGWV